MFKPAKWRSEKNRIKAVFKLQFYATQVRQSGVDALLLSIIPGDNGKPTTRLEKATVRDGICRWDNSVCETVKFIQDPKTGKISERIYNFVLSTGLSKASCIGEVSVDFAEYAEATRPSSVSLPIKNPRCAAVLHVSIQRLQQSVDQREEEECEDDKIKSHDRSLRTYLSNGDMDDESLKGSNSADDVSAKEITHGPELSPICRTSSESDITISSSDGSSGLDTPRELVSRNTKMHQNPNGFMSRRNHDSDPSKHLSNASPSVYEEHQKSHWDWSAGSENNLSTDDSTSGSNDALLRERLQPALDMEINKLKAELAVLARQVDVSDLEVQTLRKQIVKENKRGQELSKEIINLKEERDALKTECDNLKSFHKRMDEAKVRSRLQLESGDLRTLVEEIRQELSYEKDLNANLRLQLKKTQESNAELVLAVQDLDQMVEQKNQEMYNLSNQFDLGRNSQDLKGNISKCKADDDEEQKVLEELVKQHNNAKDTHLLEQKIIDLYSEIEIYRRDKDELEMQMEQLALDYEILKQENHDTAYKLEQSQLQEQLKMQYECSSPADVVNDLEAHIESLENELRRQSEEYSDSLATIKELQTYIRRLEEEMKKQAQKSEADLESVTQEKVAAVSDIKNHIESLENELKKQSDECSNSLATIKELENHIRRLEEELEKQAQGFEADLEAMTRDKVEQEQRAIRAEEALRKTRLKNANTAERLQEEFRKLSTQMASTFDANEKAAMRAITEASELRAQKSLVEEMLRNVKEELQTAKADHGVKLHELSNQIYMMTVQKQEMLLEIEEKSKQLEHQKKHKQEVSKDFSEEILMLKAENERLKSQIITLSRQADQKEILINDLELVKNSFEESEMLLQRGTAERNELVSTIELLKKEAEKSLEEITTVRNLKDENETTVRLLESELEALRAQCNGLKHSLFEDEAEKEKLRMQVLQLKGDLKEKEDALNNNEKKFKDSNGRTTLSDGTKTSPKNKKSAPIPQNSKEISSLREKVKLLEGLIKSKETALETSTNTFFKKEKELLNKIEELERTVEEFDQSSALQKVVEDRSGEAGSTVKHLNGTQCGHEENGATLSSSKSDTSFSEKEPKTLMNGKGEDNLREILTELASMKEKNNEMESELKEMQERYSEMSLKFAEVEGERQKLVMTVRSLKNAHKGF